jgi:DNA-binding SARP family transcriptional activator/tetratricopeptide (TPR) repeat protein
MLNTRARVHSGANTPLTRALPFRRNARDNLIVDLSVSVLGPLEARVGDRVIPLPRKKHRELVSLLALRAGEVVSADVLIEQLWARPPKTAREALHNYVSQVRSALGTDVIEWREPGYVLRIDPDGVDLLRFERLADEARRAGSAEECAAKLTAALALWRGPPLADLAYDEIGIRETGRLEDLRLAAREDLIDAELELGRRGDLVPELEALIAQNPFRERLIGQLMLALYRAGRQADALEAYREARGVLVDELGLEPGVQLRELEQAILRQDPALDLPAVLPPIEERRKTVTILFCELAPPEEELDPERLRRRTVRALAEARSVIEFHGGSVETRAGDELLGVFGVPRAHEDDALRAVRAAAEMRGALPELRVGVDTGEVLAGHGFVSGDVVARAKRLQRDAAPGEALLGKATISRCGEAIKAEPGDGAVRLLAVEEGARPIVRAFDTPLVGRKRELAGLGRGYDQACAEGRCRLLTVVGEAGIGKTRLARELVARIGDGATVLVGRCVSYGEGATWLPLAEMLERAGERLDPILAGAGSPGEVFLEVRRVFERLAGERPVVLVFDDVHWAEPTLLDLVEYLAVRAEGPILCLCLARTELLDERPKLGDGAIRLGPLAAPQAEKLAAGVEPGLQARLVEAAGGNPLFLEQLIAFAAVGEALDTVPPSVEDLIAARLDLLAPEERALLQRAAVVGDVFGRAVLKELGGEVRWLSELEEKGFVRRRRDGFRFHHVLVRDVAYASVPKAERAEIHERLADWLDERGEADELVGYHLEQAFRLGSELQPVDRRLRRLAADAGVRLGAAGIAAWKRGETPATVNLLGRATELLPEHDPSRLELLCELGHALQTGGELPRAEAALIRVVETASADGNRRLDLRARLELARVRLFSNPEGRADELVDVAAQAIPVFEAVGDDHSLGRVWLTLAVVHGPMHCRHGAAAEEVDCAIDHLRRSGWPISTCLAVLSAALQNGPTPVPEAVRRCRRLLAGADPAGQANVLAPLGALEAMQGRFAEARGLIASARTLFDELGQTSTAEANCGAVAGRVELLAGDLAAAEREFRSTCQALERVGNQAYLATGAAELADVLCARGRFDEAEQWCLLASKLAASDDVLTHILWRATRARLLAQRGELDEADTLARAALRRAEETDGLNRRAKVLLDLSEILRVAGRSAEAAEAVEAAVDLFERKRNIVDAKRARALLAELAVA